jgi:hypothetical protein
MKGIIPKYYPGNPLEPGYWADEQKGVCYRRICGGLAWPHTLLNRPGFGVIVGEEFNDQGPNRMPDKEDVVMHVLAEVERVNFNEFMSECAGLAQKVWYCSPYDMATTGLLAQFIRTERDAGKPYFYPRIAPLISGDGDLTQIFKYGVERIKQRNNRGTLILDAAPGVKVCLQDIPLDPARLENFSALVAICFVVGALDYYQYIHPMADKEPVFAKTDYDIFNPPFGIGGIGGSSN